jgi:integrase/recombinase XerC
MSISVHLAVALPPENPWLPHALPVGFPILIIDEQSKIIEPALLYLLDSQLKRGPRHWKPHTANAMAYDLRDWFDYLAHCTWVNPVTGKLEVGKPWDLATETDYIAYRDTAQEIISNQTKRKLASGTIARRQGSVERFYSYAQKQGWYDGEFVRSKVKKGRVGPSADEGKPTILVDSAGTYDSKSEFREAIEYGEPIRPLSETDWLKIQASLGPIPSEREFDLRLSRDRLVCELALATGMRVDEIASLTEFQLRGLYQAWLAADEEERQDGSFGLSIIKTKRAKPRTVYVPGYMIPELMAYLDEEREASIKAGAARAKGKVLKYKRPTSLFVNSPESAQHAGKAVRATSLSWAFKEACLAAGVTHYVEKIDIDTGERYLESLSKHHFHDLRHTFAVWTYHDLKSKGESEPWKPIQILLGHSSLKTTIDTYLKIVDVDRRLAGRAQYNAKHEMGKPYA